MYSALQSLVSVAKCFHTKVITTSPKAKITGSLHIQFEEHDPINTAKAIVREAVENYTKRKVDICIPEDKSGMIVGFSHETINYLLGGTFRSSYKPLNDNIINGRIRGLAGVVGCNNVRTKHDDDHMTLVKELIKKDVLVQRQAAVQWHAGKQGC